MSLIYSRVTPFGFINPETATDEDNYYGEEITDSGVLSMAEGLLARAEYLRGLMATSGSIQTTGGDSQAQAIEMAEVLSNVRAA